MAPYPLLTSLWTIFTLCLVLSPSPTRCRIAKEHYVSKRDSPGDDADLRKELETRLGAFPTDRFDSDPILLQQVDTVNEKSTYKDPQTDQEYYEHGASDKNKAAVVLTSEEDKIPLTGDKRVYVAMRQSSLEGKPKKYYASLIYLVNPEAGHGPTDLIDVKGKKMAVEYSVWNDGVLQGFKYSFQFAVCRYSVIIPCKPDLSGNATKPAEGGGAAAPAAAGSDKPKADDKEKPIEKLPTLPFTPSDYKDFFLDLDNNKIAGRFQIIGMAFDFLDKAVDGVGSLWCGLSGMILGQCHQYDPEDGYTKSQIGTPIVRSDGKILASGASNGFGSEGILGTVVNTLTMGQNKAVPTAMMNANNIPGDTVVGKQQNVETVYLNPNGKRRKRRDAGSVRMKGWRTQYAKAIEPNIIFQKEKDVFYGIGHCPPKDATPLYESAKSEAEVIAFYVTLLRNGCISRVQKVIPALKSEGLVDIKDKQIIFVPGNKLATQPKITWVEEQKLASSLEFHAISAAYKQAKEKPDADPKSPFGGKVTNSVKFLETFSLEFVAASRNLATKHNIRMLRHLVQIFRTALDRMGEDSRNMEECVGDCSKDNEILASDKLMIMGIIKFVMHGLPFKGEGSVYPQWADFAKKNQAAIEAALKESKI